MDEFTHEYVWVNEGKWESNSAVERAILHAKMELFSTGDSFIDVRVILLERLDCHDNHIDMCEHWKVTLA